MIDLYVTQFGPIPSNEASRLDIVNQLTHALRLVFVEINVTVKRKNKHEVRSTRAL